MVREAGEQVILARVLSGILPSLLQADKTFALEECTLEARLRTVRVRRNLRVEFLLGGMPVIDLFAGSVASGLLRMTSNAEGFNRQTAQQDGNLDLVFPR